MSLIEQIKKHEGYSPVAYKCTEGYDTIGYGFAIKDLYLDKESCDKILERKLSELKLKIYQKFDWYKDAPQEVQEVVINMCYQLGINGFSKFKQTIYYLETEQYPEASEEMLDSLWYRQTPNRAKELSDIIKYIGKEKIL
jgi:lysozyme